MPPRKSNVSQISSTDVDGGTPSKEREQGINIEDLSLPRTMVQRLAKGVLPPNTQLHKDAVLAFQKGATVFVNYVAAATIPPTAVFEGLRETEYEAFYHKVEAELNRFNDVQTGKRNEYRRKIKEGNKDDEGEGEGGEAINDDEERAVKRARVSGDAMEGVITGAGTGMKSEGLNGQAGGSKHMEGDKADGMEDEEDGGENDDPEEEEDEEEEEEEPKEDEVVVEEDEDDDEDEYPDEGRRFSSLEQDTYNTDRDERGRPRRGASGDEEMSDEGSD